MDTILSQTHTSHIMLSTRHHNIKNTSTQHHKHIHIIINTSIQHHQKRFKRLNITHQETHHSRHTSFIFRRIYYLRKSTSFKSIRFENFLPFLKSLLDFLNYKSFFFFFEILLRLLKFLIFFLRSNLSLGFLNLSFEL